MNEDLCLERLIKQSPNRMDGIGTVAESIS